MSEVTMWRRSPSRTGHVYLRAVSVLLLSVCGVALIALAFTPPKSARGNIAVMPPPLAAATNLSGTLPADLPLVLTIVLKRADQGAFERFLQAVQDSKSASYRHYLSPREQADRFGPSIQSYDVVNDWLQRQGFKLIEGSENRLTLTVSGTRGQAEKAFRVSMSPHQPAARGLQENTGDPLLPGDIAPLVHSVIGLSDQPVPHPTLVVVLGQTFCSLIAIENMLNNLVLDYNTDFVGSIQDGYNICLRALGLSTKALNDNSAAGPHGAGTKSVRQNASATAAPPPWLGLDGSGQTVGLLEFDTFNPSDIADYLAFFGGSKDQINNLQQVHVNGGAPLGAQESEVLLDIVAVMSLARGANVVVYDAPFAGIRTSFQTLFNRMISDHVTVISNSWVYCEDQATLADVQSIDSILASAAVAGITVVNSTGDFGSTCADGGNNVASVPADSPNALAVGGSSYFPGPVHTYGTEAYWNGTGQVPPGGAGGFGTSKFFRRPQYQDGFTASLMRSLPDVAANADPNYGIVICQADSGGCPTGALYAGTSLAAPIWAAFIAVLNQGQGHNIGAANSLLYSLGNPNAFHSPAGIGSDFQHLGLGSPVYNLVYQGLTNKTPGPVSATISLLTPDLPFKLSDGSTGTIAVADDASTATVAVRLRDSEGNLISGKTVTLAANAGSHATISSASGVSNVANGAVVFSIKNTVPETVTLTATDTTDGIVLQKQVEVVFVGPPAAAGGISANPTTVNANGSDTTTITVTLQDAKGNPSPRKVVTLSQGNGHSIITSPSPAVTDANGQIQFTATDNVSETVTYTAVDVTDRNLPVPGSASVTFTGGGTSCVGAPPAAAPGFTLTPFANGFVARNFSFSGVNWGGCPGASNPSFDTAGSVYVPDFADGNLYKLGSGTGGAATNANVLANLGLTLTQMAFSKDGKLYAAHSATGGGLNSGNVIQIDPSTGTVVKVVASGLTCPSPPAVDPLSGDLFLTDICHGGGTDNPSLFRITNPASASPTVTVYATLPSSPNGSIAFAPDGTLYVVSGYTGPQSIVRVAGTNTPSPPAMTTLSGISSDFWVTLGAAQPNGAAKSLLVTSQGVLKLVDITTTPFTTTILANGPAISSGTIGSDGCLYISNSDSIFKLAPSTGGCGFNPTNPGPALALTPETISPSPQGTTATFTAQLKNVAAPANIPVTLFVSGANPGAHLVRTDANGNAVITYTGMFTGTDQAFASAVTGDSTVFSNNASVTWMAGKHSTFLTLNQSPGSGAPNKAIKLKGDLVDVSVSIAAAIPNAAVNFNLAGQSCTGFTDAKGQVTCSVTPTVPAGPYEVTASFAGTSQFLASSAKKGFDLIVPPPHQLLNISTRMRVLTGDKALIGGFIVTGSEPKKVIIRGMGPSLGGAGVSDTLQDPILELHPANGPVITNDNWKDTQRSEIEASGIPPGDDREAAIVATLPPGNYTAILSGKDGTIGAGLVEVYDLSQPVDARLANISTRGFVDTGDNIMIAGFIAGPDTGTLVQVLVRAIGPSLTFAGVPDALQDPTLELHDGNGGTIAMNDDWKETQQTDIEQTGIPPADDRESAILSPLAPGNYTAILRGKNNTTGTALVEVYNLP